MKWIAVFLLMIGEAEVSWGHNLPRILRHKDIYALVSLDSDTASFVGTRGKGDNFRYRVSFKTHSDRDLFKHFYFGYTLKAFGGGYKTSAIPKHCIATLRIDT